MTRTQPLDTAANFIPAPDYGIPDDDDLDLVGMVGRSFQHYAGSHLEFNVLHETSDTLFVLFVDGREGQYQRCNFLRMWREGFFQEL
jgi:hypothetical protein